jgi:small-conductance mechanosensitive channel
MTLITVPIKTFSAEDIVKLSATFEVHYDSDIPKVLEVVTKAINGFTFTKEKENTKVFVSNFGDSNIEIKAFFYFDPKCGIIPDIALGEINEKINQEFEKNNIEISYDTVTLTFEDTMAKQAFIKNIENTTPSI